MVMTPPGSSIPASNAKTAGAPSGSRRSSRSRRVAKAGPASPTADDQPVQTAGSHDESVDPSRPGTRSAEQTILVVGTRIRALRLGQQLTLRDVAERTGVSVSMLSMLERGVSTASVGTLVAVASALEVHMHELFSLGTFDTSSPLTRVGEQAVFRMGSGTTRRVAHNDSAAGIELAVNTYEPGGTSGTWATHHGGREFGVLISGRLTIELDGESHVLESGDVIAYSSDRSHRIANRSDEHAVAVWINVHDS